MTDIQYERAPITEAVVEFKFSAKIDEKKYEKAIAQLEQVYDNHKKNVQRKVDINLDRPTNPVKGVEDTRIDSFFSNNMTQRVVIRPDSFAVAVLAPYTCWDDFKKRILRDRDIWQKYAGFQKIDRIGMRYINRLDLPLVDGKVNLSNYVKVYPLVPTDIGTIHRYTFVVESEIPEIGALVRLHSARVESPLPDHDGLVLDIDIFRFYEEAVNSDVLHEFLEKARINKNSIFENSITDKARELFGYE